MVRANNEMVNLAEELIRIGKEEIRMPLRKLSRFCQKMDKLCSGEIHPGDVIIPLVRELKANVRRSKRLDNMDKDFRLLILDNKEKAYYDLLSNMFFTKKGK
jgi:hypothetical protein